MLSVLRSAREGASRRTYLEASLALQDATVAHKAATETALFFMISWVRSTLACPFKIVSPSASPS